MKRNFGIQVTAILVLLWYCFGIIGFNVHTCSSSDSSFIVTFLEDMSCNAIHPAEHCTSVNTCCCCCDHAPESSSSSDESFESPDCCTNDYQVLTVTADRTGEGQKLSLPITSFVVSALYHNNNLRADSYLSGSKMNGPPLLSREIRGLHLVCNVWRI